MIATELADARRLAWRVVLGQAAVTLLIGLVSWLVEGRSTAIAALLGGGISTLGSVAMALLGFRSPARASGLALLAALLIGEAAKFCVIVVLFVLVLTLIKISAAAMLTAYAATFLVYWLVLASWLPLFRGGGAERGRDVRA